MKPHHKHVSPLFFWATKNSSIVTGQYEYATTLKVVLDLNNNLVQVHGASLIEMRQGDIADWMAFRLANSTSHPLAFVLKRGHAGVISVEVSFGNMERSEFLENYLITHLQVWPYEHLTNEQLFSTYIPLELRKLMITK